MSEAMTIAVSGLRSAETRVASAAMNLVNMQSGAAAPTANSPYSGYVPQQAVATSAAGGGVNMAFRPVDPSYVLAADTDGGQDAMPNINEASEVVELQTASTAYKASAAVIRTSEEMSNTLLDVLG